ANAALSDVLLKKTPPIPVIFAIAALLLVTGSSTHLSRTLARRQHEILESNSLGRAEIISDGDEARAVVEQLWKLICWIEAASIVLTLGDRLHQGLKLVPFDEGFVSDIGSAVIVGVNDSTRKEVLFSPPAAVANYMRPASFHERIRDLAPFAHQVIEGGVFCREVVVTREEGHGVRFLVRDSGETARPK